MQEHRYKKVVPERITDHEAHCLVPAHRRVLPQCVLSSKYMDSWASKGVYGCHVSISHFQRMIHIQGR